MKIASLYMLLFFLFVSSCISDWRKKECLAFSYIDSNMTIDEVNRILGEPDTFYSDGNIRTYFYFSSNRGLSALNPFVAFDTVKSRVIGFNCGNEDPDHNCKKERMKKPK